MKEWKRKNKNETKTLNKMRRSEKDWNKEEFLRYHRIGDKDWHGCFCVSGGKREGFEGKILDWLGFEGIMERRK